MANRIVAKITVTEAEASCAQNTILTSGMAGTQLEFSFSEQWEGLSKTVVFIAGDVTSYAYLTTDNTCLIPSEVLVTPRIPLVVGVYGADGTTVVIPTIYTSLGLIAVGTGIPSDEEIGVTQSLYDQVTALQVAMAGELVNIKETEIKEVDLDASEAGKIGTASVSLQTTWIDYSDHSQGKKATFTFKNLKGNGIKSIAFNDNNNLVITQTDGTTTTFGGVAAAITAMESLESAVSEAEAERKAEWDDMSSEIRTAAKTATSKAEEATTAASGAKTSETNAGNSASAAATSASEASTSASNAASSATSASSSKDSAYSSSQSAGNSASAAATSMSAAQTAQTAAESAKSSAESARDSAISARDATIQAKTDGVNAINSAKTSAISAITTQQTASVKAVTDEGATQVQKVKDEGASYQAELDTHSEQIDSLQAKADVSLYVDSEGYICLKE